ncbi:MAG TPA: hypothetical protein VFQ65_05310 [Kofleriaceae bacterium]|nr:hypothetical protein [Kofleriaceae bacterium]
MKALAVLVMLAGVAIAGPVVTPPAGWTARESPDLAKTTGEIGHFAAHAFATIGAAEIKPATDLGVTLFATKVAMKIANDPAAVRAEVDTFHGASQRAQLTGSVVQEQGWQEKADAKQVEATLAFHDTTNHITSTSRMLVVATADQLIEVTGECLARDDADPVALAACKAALATLDPGADARVAIALAPAGTAAPERDEPVHSGPVISEGPRTPLPPMVIRPDTQPDVDRRPVFIGAGIVLLAIVFWWNMKRRAQLEDEEDG